MSQVVPRRNADETRCGTRRNRSRNGDAHSSALQRIEVLVAEPPSVGSPDQRRSFGKTYRLLRRDSKARCNEESDRQTEHSDQQTEFDKRHRCVGQHDFTLTRVHPCGPFSLWP
jgi:hypothetical protein